MDETEGVLSGSGDSHQTHDIPNAVAPTPGSIEDLEGSTRSLGRYLPSVGDRAILDGQLVEIVTFDTAANLFTAEVQVGRSVNRITGHISNTRFEPLSGDGTHTVTGDGLDLAQRETSMISSPTQESIDEGLARTTASQGNQFTSYSQQHLLAQQPQAGDPQELVIRKLAGDVELETPSDRESVDANAPAESTDSASVSQHESE